MNTPSPQSLLNTAQAASFLGLEPGTLINWRSTRRQILPFVRLGRSIRYRQSDLEAFVEQNVSGDYPEASL